LRAADSGEREHVCVQTNSKEDIPPMAQRPARLPSLLFLPAICLLLAGCFQSEQPKFPLANAAAALDQGGRYVVYERGPDNTYQRQEVLQIKHRDDGAYDFVDEKGETVTISFHALGGDLFVGQAKAEKDQPGYGYTIVRIAGNEAVLYVPQCDDQDKAVLAAASVEVNGQLECIIDRIADAPALFKRLDPGEPVSKLVRD
jgi:hypothetical protein